MKKIPVHVRRRIKQHSKSVRVIGVEQPPDDTITEDELSQIDPYITDVELADWFQEFQRKKIDGSAHKIEEEDTTYMSLLLSDAQNQLFDGIYEATKENPLFAMEAFVTAHQLGLYPPRWVLDWLYTAFGKYLSSSQGEDLAALLLVKRGKGETPIKKEGRKLHAENAAMQQIFHLNVGGASIENAAAIVAERYEAQDIKCPSADTLAERFTKRGWGSIAKALKKAIKKSGSGVAKT